MTEEEGVRPSFGSGHTFPLLQQCHFLALDASFLSLIYCTASNGKRAYGRQDHRVEK